MAPPYMSLLKRPIVSSPHSGAVNDLSIDNGCEGRFLLAGAKDGTVSAYDLSPLTGSDWAVGGGLEAVDDGAPLAMHGGGGGGGGDDDDDDDDDYDGAEAETGTTLARISTQVEENLGRMRRRRAKTLRVHSPVARSRRESAAAVFGSRQRRYGGGGCGGGHRHSVTFARWYPVDTGAFVSADAGGSVLVWDANAFSPVSSLQIVSSIGGSGVMAAAATANLTTMCNLGVKAADLPNRWNCSSHMLLAVGCGSKAGCGGGGGDDRPVRLCDLRSGSSSHELVGHGPRGGVNAVAWSPTDAFVLASGGEDGTVRLWDIRKSGSGSCLGVLNREEEDDEDNEEDGKRGDCHYNNEYGGGGRGKRRKPNAPPTATAVAPGDYSRVQSRGVGAVQSHGGPVTAIAYSPDGWYLASSGMDGRVRLWDLRPRCGPCRKSRGGKFGVNVRVGARGGVGIGGPGRPLPTTFLGPSNSVPNLSNVMDYSSSRTSVLIVTQPGSKRTASLYVGGGRTSGDVLIYEMHGPGGRPVQVLSGHLDGVTSIAKREADMTVYTGGRDGMILGWGRRRVGDGDDDDDELGQEEEKKEEIATAAFFARTRRWRGGRQRRVRGTVSGGRRVDADCW